MADKNDAVADMERDAAVTPQPAQAERPCKRWCRCACQGAAPGVGVCYCHAYATEREADLASVGVRS